MELEGILIHKAIHKERDLIGTLLLREGSIASFYFYGGRGGGKSQKGTILELGFMLKVKLASRQKKNQQLLTASEWSLGWSSEHIRKNHQAFYLSTFFFEFIKKVAVEKDIDFDSKEHEGLFKVLSNSLFYMDNDLSLDNFHLETHCLFFLAKIIFELGIAPDLESCLYCQDSLVRESFVFDVQNGGFTCSSCSNQTIKEELIAATKVRDIIIYSKLTTYKEFKTQNYLERAQIHSLINYLCYHYGWNKSQFISLAMIL